MATARRLNADLARTGARKGVPVGCRVCDHTGWVCEDHSDRPYKRQGRKNRSDACDCGIAVGCVCNPHGSIEMVADPEDVVCSVWDEHEP